MSAEHESAASGPLRDLDEAIRAMHEHDGRTVSGWALVIATTRIDADKPPGIEPLTFGAGHAVSTGTHPATALGLVEGLALHLRRIVAHEVVDED